MRIPAAELKTAAWLVGILTVLYFLPVGTARFDGAVTESLELAKFEKVTDFLRFAELGVMITPALVVDGKVKATGKIPSDAELEKLLQS